MRKERIALLYPVFFIGRRLLFAFVVIFQETFTWLHLAFYGATTIAMLIYIGYVRPFDTE